MSVLGASAVPGRALVRVPQKSEGPGLPEQNPGALGWAAKRVAPHQCGGSPLPFPAPVLQPLSPNRPTPPPFPNTPQQGRPSPVTGPGAYRQAPDVVPSPAARNGGKFRPMIPSPMEIDYCQTAHRDTSSRDDEQKHSSRKSRLSGVWASRTLGRWMPVPHTSITCFHRFSTVVSHGVLPRCVISIDGYCLHYLLTIDLSRR